MNSQSTTSPLLDDSSFVGGAIRDEKLQYIVSALEESLDDYEVFTALDYALVCLLTEMKNVVHDKPKS